ncbi:Importin-beta domain-containing protein [Scedosporium apiospermum]|uniref:Importin-beta domain-containing protein n=1 Tax=Pseudallescheria apiosperma TaxID=563466 RepID=A0A084G263_PSEDA|nr:Importin-beta domain-containing protein [Scedosporium apiospermum]KEZ41425.1 Importin-beta domain-containing protein [Scedosporium apiospermum]
MDDELVQVLTNTQSPDQPVRHQAELALNHAKSNPAFPVSLANVAAHTSVDTSVRQAALSSLRLFIESNWNPDDQDVEPVIAISDEARAQLRRILLELTLSPEENRKVKIAASYAVGKMAIHDLPDKWPELLPNLLSIIPTGTDAQVHGALRTISDIVEDSLSEDQFFSMARDIIKALTVVALDENRTPTIRSLSVSVFRSCFDLMDIVKEEHPKEVKAFGDELLKEWGPFFLQALKARLPNEPVTASCQPQSWNGLIMLKLQVLKTLLKIRTVLPQLISAQALDYFSAVWEELLALQGPHKELYLDNNAQDRLEDIDNLPYSLDFLILEELDLIHQFLRAPPVHAQLDAQLQAHPSAQETPWLTEIMKTLVAFSRITQEEEGLWDIDCSLYLAEEASASANYTSRTAAGDVLIKLGETYSQAALDGLFGYTQTLFTGEAAGDWRSQEAALYLFNMLASDFDDMGKTIPEQTARAYLALVDYAINQAEWPLLRARGYLVGGTLTRSFATPDTLIERILQCINSEEAEVVRVACIKAVEHLVRAKRVTPEHQIPIIQAISQYMQNKDPEDMEDADELLVTIAESLRLVINVDHRVALATNVQPVDILFTLARHGASNFQVTMIVTESFEDIVRNLTDPTSYTALSAKVLPIITAAFDVANLTQDDPLVTVAVELLVVLIQHGTEPLPPGFISATLPKLKRLLMEAVEGEVLRPAAESLKYLLMHDHHQVFGWHDESGQSGLDVCLLVIDRLLGSAIEDNSASEVGGLAAELVEKAGHERLGPYLPQLLRAVATRLSTAQAAPFIQSLILVFARLSLVGAHDVVEFLSQIQIGDQSGLHVVLGKWLENSVNFAGYDEIRQNVIALSKLYSLNDPRLSQTMVKGDLIVTDTDRIKTRSRAKQNPDQYTIIPASLKILKVLIQELLSASGSGRAAATAAALAAAAELEEDDGDDNWEDEPDSVDLGLGTSKSDLYAFIESSGSRQQDDETQAYLTEFFVSAARDNVANFQEWYTMLTDEERTKLQELASQPSA